MPRRKKSAKPLRDSGGSASPSPAMRRLSYSATKVESRSEHAVAVLGTSVEFFFHGAHARSSLGVRRGRILAVSTVPTRAHGSVRLERAVLEGTPGCPLGPCAAPAGLA